MGERQNYAALLLEELNRSFRIRAPFVKIVFCLKESMAEPIERAPAKPSPAKRRRFQMFKKVYREK